MWTFLGEAETPDRIAVGSVVVAGDSDDRFLARVVDIVPGSGLQRTDSCRDSTSFLVDKVICLPR